jgi:hypothetical protein
MITQQFMWENIENFGCEYLKVQQDNSDIYAEGTVIYKNKSIPYKVNYTVHLDPNWLTRKVIIDVDGLEKKLVLESDGNGNWVDGAGNELDFLAGAIDIDISVTPFSNSLPINRHSWELAQKREFEMVYLQIPEMEMRKVKQVYTFVRDLGLSRIFYYESGSYKTEITVDPNGFVLDYPDLFLRR